MEAECIEHKTRMEKLQTELTQLQAMLNAAKQVKLDVCRWSFFFKIYLLILNEYKSVEFCNNACFTHAGSLLTSKVTDKVKPEEVNSSTLQF